MNTSAVPAGWYSATQQYRPITIPYVAEKGSKTVYSTCISRIAAGGIDMQLDMAQMPGQPITFKIVNLATTGTFPAAGTATTQPLEFRLRKYGC
jgi:hypothetical protein